MRVMFSAKNCFVTFCLFILGICLSCNTTKTLSTPIHVESINAHRQKTESGLTIGDRAPLTKEELKNLRYFDVDQTYKTVAKVTLSEGEEPFELPTYSGITKTFIKYATLNFRLNNENLSLNVYRNLETIRMPQYRNYLFLPYMDGTSGESTYGGGRYINLTTLDIEDNKVELDFNKSYNPWCAYSDGYNCPIPPIENHLDIAILAGERNYAGPHKE